MKSGIIAAVGLTVLLSLSCLSVISVVAYAGLALFCCTAACRLYQLILGSPKSINDQAPASNIDRVFGDWATCDVQLPKEKIADRVSNASEKISENLNYLRRVILLQDYLETFKWVFLLYLLSVIGGWFNLLTLFTIAFVFALTCPKIYIIYQPQFDSIYDKAKGRLSDFYKKIEPKLSKFRGSGHS